MTETTADLRRYEHVTVIGGGVIGLSWAALFLEHGLHVCINDPAPEAEQHARTGLADLLKDEDWESRLDFEADLSAAVRDADVVQENAPDRLRLKQRLWATVETAAPAAALLLSSSSGIPASLQARKMRDRGRLMIGHPFNPPHILPLVEVVPSRRTPPTLAEEAVAFYRALDKHPVLLAKEVPGFAANRLQAALFRECVWLVRAGALTPEQIDDVVTHSLGPRWASDGPFASFVQGGGERGFAGFLDQFSRGMQLLWLHSRLRPVLLTPRMRASLTDQVKTHEPATLQELNAHRDRRLRAVLNATSQD